MDSQDLVLDLVLCWEELTKQGQKVSFEELCADRPELLEAVKQAIRHLEIFKQVAGGEAEGPGDGGAEDEGGNTSCIEVSIGSVFRNLRYRDGGGMGEVWAGEDAKLHRPAAIKFMKKSANRRRSGRRFRREAKVTSELQHPCIVPIYGIGRHPDGRPCYAMPLIEGVQFDVAIKAFHDGGTRPSRDPGEQALALRMLLNHFVAVCNAVAYAHSHGVLHRDIKPQNILLAKRDGKFYGERYLIDWGIAKRVGQTSPKPSTRESPVESSTGGENLTPLRGTPGTPGFMSPEQCKGEMLGPASDIFGLGATLYVLLTGQSPFEGDRKTVMACTIAGKFKNPRERNKEIPPGLEAICLKAMANKPEDRYQSALDLADDIEHWLADEPVQAYRESLLRRLARWTRKHRTLEAIGATALITLLLGLTVDWTLLHQQLAVTEQQLQETVAAHEQAKKSLESLHQQLAVAEQQRKELIAAKEDAERARKGLADEARKGQATLKAAIDAQQSAERQRQESEMAQGKLSQELRETQEKLTAAITAQKAEARERLLQRIQEETKPREQPREQPDQGNRASSDRAPSSGVTSPRSPYPNTPPIRLTRSLVEKNNGSMEVHFTVTGNGKLSGVDINDVRELGTIESTILNLQILSERDPQRFQGKLEQEKKRAEELKKKLAQRGIIVE